jgi:chromosome segregation ATPase
VEINKELEELDKNLVALKENFNKQMNAIESNLHDFHDQVITLSSEYPEHKKILKFIVYVNDKLETNQTEFKMILTELMNELITIKRNLVKETIRGRIAPSNNLSIWEKLNAFKDLKWLLTIILVIILLVGFIFIPDTMVHAISWIIKLAL